MNSYQHQNIITLVPNPFPSDNEKLLYASNPLPYSENLCLSGSAFFTNLEAPNRKFPNVNQYHQK